MYKLLKDNKNLKKNLSRHKNLIFSRKSVFLPFFRLLAARETRKECSNEKTYNDLTFMENTYAWCNISFVCILI